MCDDARVGASRGETVTDLGPEERELFETQARPLYEEAAVNGGLPESDPRIAKGGELRPALDLLVSLNLLVHDRSSLPVPPGRPVHGVVPRGQPDEPAGCRAAQRVLGVGARLRPAVAVVATLTLVGPRPDHRVPRRRHRHLHRGCRPRGRDGAPHRAAAGRCATAAPRLAVGRRAREGRARPRRDDADALPAQRTSPRAPRASTSRRSPPTVPRCGPSTSSSTG